MEKIILRISGFYGKSSIYASDNGKHTLWIYDQSDHMVSVRKDMTAEDVPKAAVTIINSDLRCVRNLHARAL